MRRTASARASRSRPKSEATRTLAPTEGAEQRPVRGEVRSRRGGRVVAHVEGEAHARLVLGRPLGDRGELAQARCEGLEARCELVEARVACLEGGHDGVAAGG